MHAAIVWRGEGTSSKQPPLRPGALSTLIPLLRGFVFFNGS